MNGGEKDYDRPGRTSGGWMVDTWGTDMTQVSDRYSPCWRGRAYAYLQSELPIKGVKKGVL